MKNLLIDIGNTSLKAAWSNGVEIDDAIICRDEKPLAFIRNIVSHKRLEIIALSTIRNMEPDFFTELETLADRVIVAGTSSCRPIKNLSNSPEILAPDRICSALAASDLFPGRDIAIFDFGTALSVDFISSNKEFIGGNISPGLTSRLRSLNQYTQQLPLLTPPEEIKSLGETTTSAIESGVVLGLIFEIEGYIRQYPNHIHIFTGGDAIYFAEKVKKPIFVVYNLVLMGLARIAENYAKV